MALIVGAATFGASLVAATYVGSRRQWIALPIGLGRVVTGVLPLLLLAAVPVFEFAGWGDIEEHWVRAFLHSVHRVLPDHGVRILVAVIIAAMAAVVMSFAVWLSSSILARRYKIVLLVPFFSVALLLLAIGDFGVLRTNALRVALVILLFSFGVLFSVAVLANVWDISGAKLWAASFALILVMLVGGGYLLNGSTPEPRWPGLRTQPLWTLDITQSGCQPSFAGPDPSSAPNEISFSDENTLGMTFPIDPAPGRYSSCVFTVDTRTGQNIAHADLKFAQPSITGLPNGAFIVAAGDDSMEYSRALQPMRRTTAHREDRHVFRVADLERRFQLREDGVWFLGDGQPRRVLPPSCEWSLHALTLTRILVTGCTQFFVLDAQGNRLASHDFVRPRPRFAAESREGGRFALAIYVWGFGDPSYLEEETIVVYDTASLQPVFAVKSAPLPQRQSWAALSPDGTLLAVGADHKLRLFRIPSNSNQ